MQLTFRWDVAASIEFIRHPRARRYVISVRDNGTVRVTLPRWGSKREAARFADVATLRRQVAIPRACERKNAPCANVQSASCRRGCRNWHQCTD